MVDKKESEMEQEQFDALNRRRVELIEKKHKGGGLTVDEESELAGLQQLAGEHVEGLATVDPDVLAQLRAKYVEFTGAA